MLHLLKSYTSVEGLSTCGMGAQGLGCSDPLDKNNMDFSGFSPQGRLPCLGHLEDILGIGFKGDN